MFKALLISGGHKRSTRGPKEISFHPQTFKNFLSLLILKWEFLHFKKEDICLLRISGCDNIGPTFTSSINELPSLRRGIFPSGPYSFPFNLCHSFMLHAGSQVLLGLQILFTVNNPFHCYY